jgi:hypothetical protein
MFEIMVVFAMIFILYISSFKFYGHCWGIQDLKQRREFPIDIFMA